MKRVLLVLALASFAAPAFARIRVVRHPAEPCSFSLVPTWSPSTIPAAGVTRGAVWIYGQTAACSQWTGFSSVDWVTVEAAPMDAQPAAYVTVAPNPATSPRTTTLIIAGIRLDVTQDGAPTITNPSLVVNGTFDTNIDGWIWQDRFPNGRGNASWSALDANGSPASGSILMTDSSVGNAFQRLQCFPATKNTTYRFGAKVRTTLPAHRGAGAIALFTYKTQNCEDDAFTDGEVEDLSPLEPNVWQEFEFTMTSGSKTQSLLLVIGSGAEIPPFETYFDDVFVVLDDE